MSDGHYNQETSLESPRLWHCVDCHCHDMVHLCFANTVLHIAAIQGQSDCLVNE